MSIKHWNTVLWLMYKKTLITYSKLGCFNHWHYFSLAFLSTHLNLFYKVFICLPNKAPLPQNGFFESSWVVFWQNMDNSFNIFPEYCTQAELMNTSAKLASVYFVVKTALGADTNRKYRMAKRKTVSNFAPAEGTKHQKPLTTYFTDPYIYYY